MNENSVASGGGRRSLRLLAVASLAVGVVAVVPGLDLLFAAIALPLPVALMAFGARRRAAPRWLGWLFAGLAVWLEVVALALLALRGEVAAGPWVAGLPVALAVQLYGLCLLPLPVVTVAYALAFPSDASADPSSETTFPRSDADGAQ